MTQTMSAKGPSVQVSSDQSSRLRDGLVQVVNSLNSRPAELRGPFQVGKASELKKMRARINSCH